MLKSCCLRDSGTKVDMTIENINISWHREPLIDVSCQLGIPLSPLYFAFMPSPFDQSECVGTY